MDATETEMATETETETETCSTEDFGFDNCDEDKKERHLQDKTIQESTG